ncbi:MAG: 50S ribosomal protein L28 [Dehalococcoidia bacterium]|nr:50S ribosomal protein L28 [Dehalococcoidia bacterium]MCL0058320.1 50S ribosomal protein L28 [Dehalococcoidia bacterium]MCL0076685.1 50S ribosomal protein L28 [Dehalococcoidia bacterium]MCL0078771.1 50S ribosomal protein L28 [Dehalococcoidia bacterium]MCL0089500.1 50S ribosomal protein L28 [Dehalococcoidia bacterium]
MKCEICGKNVQFGHNVSHSNRRTKRRWLPNIVRTSLIVNGIKKRVRMCTRCLRTQHKLEA